MTTIMTINDYIKEKKGDLTFKRLLSLDRKSINRGLVVDVTNRFSSVCEL